MMKVLSVLILFCLSLAIYANPIDKVGAKQIAEQFFKQALKEADLSQHLGRLSTDITLQLAYEPSATAKTEAFTPEYYIFTSTDSVGFVIIAGDDKVEPIVGYSLNGSFSTQQIPSALSYYLKSYEHYIRDVRMGKVAPQARTYQSSTPVAPLISTLWNQISPYNTYTPTINNESTVVGCFAIAISQIMKYHNWPKAGHGTCHATLNDGYKTPISLTLGEEYNWDQIGTFYSEHVGKLVRDVGYACSSCYGTNKTEAYTADALKALLRHFDYSPDMRLIDRRYYSNESWRKIMISELNEQRPVWICGQDTGGKGGHGFICCGVDQNEYFYINWGWGGKYDGYFDIDVLAPYENYDFSGEQQAIINIKPTEEGENENDFPLIPHVGGIEIFNENNDLFEPWIEYTIYVTNTSDRTIAGHVGYAVYQDNNMLSAEICEMSYYDEIFPNWWWRWNQIISLTDIGKLTNGFREIRFFWKPDGTDKWHTPLGENYTIYVETNDEGNFYYTERPDNMPNNNNGINATDIKIKNIAGGICVTAPKEMLMNIYSVNAMLIKSIRLAPYQTQIIELPRGIYIINGKRVIVQQK